MFQINYEFFVAQKSIFLYIFSVLTKIKIAVGLSIEVKPVVCGAGDYKKRTRIFMLPTFQSTPFYRPIEMATLQQGI